MFTSSHNIISFPIPLLHGKQPYLLEHAQHKLGPRTICHHVRLWSTRLSTILIPIFSALSHNLNICSHCNHCLFLDSGISLLYQILLQNKMLLVFISSIHGRKAYTHTQEREGRKKGLFKHWPLMSSIILYCIFNLHDMAYTEASYAAALFAFHLAPSRASTDILAVGREPHKNWRPRVHDQGCWDSSHNLRLRPSHLPIFTLSGSGANHGPRPGFSSSRSMIFETWPCISEQTGLCTECCNHVQMISIPLLTSYHYIAMLSGITLVVVLNAASLLKNVLSVR